MPAEGRENPLLKKGNSDAFFREKYLTKNTEDEGSAVAEGILDRIINNKYSIEVKGRISMRKRHAFSDEGSGVNDNG